MCSFGNKYFILLDDMYSAYRAFMPCKNCLNEVVQRAEITMIVSQVKHTLEENLGWSRCLHMAEWSTYHMMSNLALQHSYFGLQHRSWRTVKLQKKVSQLLSNYMKMHCNLNYKDASFTRYCFHILESIQNYPWIHNF